MVTAQLTEIKQSRTLIDLLHYRATQKPGQVAYRFDKGGSCDVASLTYESLNLQARSIAAYLHQLDVPVGSRILLLYKPGLDFAAAFFGCLYAGMVAVPIQTPTHLKHLSRVETIATDTQAALFLTTHDLLPQLQDWFAQFQQTYSSLRISGIATDNLLHAPSSWREPRIAETETAFLQYTSGSTGSPKGVMVSHRNILHNSAIIYQAFGHSACSEGVIWLPHFHDMGLIGGILQPLYGGFPVTLMSPESVMIRPLRWLKAITQHQATTSGGPNFAYEWCVRRIKPEQLEHLDLSCWTVAFTGAEPVRAETLERFAKKFAACGFRREAFYPCYGMAETTLFVTGGYKSKAPTIKWVDAEALEQNQAVSASPECRQQAVVSCGHPWLGQQVMIVDIANLTPCLDGQVGEIWVTGKSIAQGYWQKPFETKQTFHAYLADSGAGPFLRTGDLGFWLDGELFITGRLKELVIIRGRNCYPQDIELTVQKSHPILQPEGCVALSIETDDGEQLVVLAEVQRRYWQEIDSATVVQTIRQAIAQAHELSVSEVILLKAGSLPKTTSGKLQRRACREQFQKDVFITRLERGES